MHFFVVHRSLVSSAAIDIFPSLSLDHALDLRNKTTHTGLLRTLNPLLPVLWTVEEERIGLLVFRGVQASILILEDEKINLRERERDNR